ncbi:MAG: hypothetical protein ACW981_00100 [Candidatus Hodarchaeales archaeon]|jgi:hypothetical protein
MDDQKNLNLSIPNLEELYFEEPIIQEDLIQEKLQELISYFKTMEKIFSPKIAPPYHLQVAFEIQSFFEQTLANQEITNETSRKNWFFVVKEFPKMCGHDPPVGCYFINKKTKKVIIHS